ncbi:MAG TPA: heavy metal-binding domain-containing protein [Chthoniobacteraceae bacterium]|nr:heavy metal-binding domain-containing protein [Chthoniobacteraceae bacterium]
MFRFSNFLILVSASVVAGCSTPPVAFDRTHPANPQAREASISPARPRLAQDELTRETERRFASANEVQTNEPPPIQQAGAPKQRELGAVKEGAEKMHGMQHGADAKPAPTGAYTCPMHPEVRSDKPGKCPKCGMKLVKGKEASGEEHKH